MFREAHLGLQPHNGLGYWDHRSLVFHRLGCSIRSILKNSHFSTCVLAISVEPVRLFLDLFYDKAELIFASCFCLHENVIKDRLSDHLLPACLLACLVGCGRPLEANFFLLLGTAPCDRTTIFRLCFWFVSFLSLVCHYFSLLYFSWYEVYLANLRCGDLISWRVLKRYFLFGN